jgi:hypothetical protein
MTAGGSTLDDARRELYAGARETFVERRKELAVAARSRGDRDEAKLIEAMRKPSAAAHLVNLLAHSDDHSLQELVELGASIRGAMAEGDDREIRSLLQRRAAAISKTVAQARKLARANGESVSGAVSDQIAQTLRAAMGSDDAAAAVVEGTLTDALEEPGFGGFSIEPAARQPSPKSSGKPKAEPEAADDADRAAEEAAERAARQARGKLAAAELKRAEKVLAATTKRRDGLEQDRDQLASQLALVEDELTLAQEAVADAETQVGRAAAELEAATDPPPG